MINVIGIGDNVCDKYKDLNMMYPGGQTFNFAVFAKQLGYNAAFIGVFGDDFCAEHMINTCKLLDVDISHSRHTAGENAYSVVNLIDGERSFVGSNRGGVLRLNPLKFTDEDLKYIKQFQIIHTSDRSYIESELEVLSSLGSVISFDFSTTWARDGKTQEICKHINFAFMSCSDLDECEIKEQMIDTYNWGTDLVVATRGSEESIVYDGDSFFSSKPGFVKVIDSLGAGDSFSAAFTTFFIENIWEKKEISRDRYIKLVNKCLEFANSEAAKTCVTMGAFGYGIEIL